MLHRPPSTSFGARRPGKFPGVAADNVSMHSSDPGKRSVRVVRVPFPSSDQNYQSTCMSVGGDDFTDFHGDRRPSVDPMKNWTNSVGDGLAPSGPWAKYAASNSASSSGSFLTTSRKPVEVVVDKCIYRQQPQSNKSAPSCVDLHGPACVSSDGAVGQLQGSAGLRADSRSTTSSGSNSSGECVQECSLRSAESNKGSNGGSTTPVRERPEWGSRLSFLVATLGAAIGIGSVWRFPAYCFKFGGGAFLLPYFLLLAVIGVPLLGLEMALGQVFRGGQMKIMSLLSPSLRGLAFATILQSFFICAYYSVFLSWGLRFLLASLQNNLPWGFSAEQAARCTLAATEASCLSGSPGGFCRWNVGSVFPGQETSVCTPDFEAKATNFLYSDILGLDPANPSLGMSWLVVFGLALVWMSVYFSLFKGLHSLTVFCYLAVALPVAGMILVMVKALTLQGASVGVRQLFRLDVTVLASRPEVWGAAASQVFFSLGVFQGTMTAYASHKRVTQNTTVDAIAVAGSNTALSLVSGIATFAVAGHVALATGAINSVTGVPNWSALRAQGSQLVFTLYPVALARLPLPQLFCFVFFVAFLLLGISSAVSFVQPVVDLIRDSRSLHTSRLWVVTLVLCVLGFILGIPFCLTTGMWLIETADYYWNVIGLSLVGCCECLAFGWVYGQGRQTQLLGGTSVLSFLFTYVISVIVGCSLAFFGGSKIPGYYGVIVGVCIFALGTTFSVALAKRHMLRAKRLRGAEGTDGAKRIISWQLSSTKGADGNVRLTSICLWLFFGNVEHLRRNLNLITASNSRFLRLFPVWSLLIKYVTPTILFMLLFHAFAVGDLGVYGGIPMAYQAAALSLVVVVGFCILLGILCPDTYLSLTPVEFRRGSKVISSMASRSGEGSSSPSSVHSEGVAMQDMGTTKPNAKLQQMASEGEAATEASSVTAN